MNIVEALEALKAGKKVEMRYLKEWSPVVLSNGMMWVGGNQVTYWLTLESLLSEPDRFRIAKETKTLELWIVVLCDGCTITCSTELEARRYRNVFAIKHIQFEVEEGEGL